ncbi:FAD-dependent oxidoreductase [Immundisolibacter sp.]|uniref:FAD-dependent oxidoreductase n=1 Tax=Immundisolibacter sp. TaxID=1934948 RepID=UPI0035655D2D
MTVSKLPLSRRRLLQGSAALAAGAGMGLLKPAAAAEPMRWDDTVDVLVVGAGAAGASAALTAQRLGAKVLIIEKAPYAGGTTMKSVGGIWVPNNRFLRQAGVQDTREDALRYMVRLSYPEYYDARHPSYGAPTDGLHMIATYYDHAARVLDGWQDAGVLNLSNEFAPGVQMPDYYAHLPQNKVPSGRALVPMTPDGKVGNGAELVRQFRAALDAAGIPIQTGLRAHRLIMEAGHVAGLAVTSGEGKTLHLRARRGVIFASGGFTHNPRMRRDFLKGPVFGGCAQPASEGDFITIAGEVGAQLGNMSNAWWCQIPLDQALDSPSVPTGIWCTPGDAMVQVNRFGRRFLNEKFVYNERTQVHFQWDPVAAEYPNLLSFMIYDARTATEFAGYAPIPPIGPLPPHVHTADTLDELASRLAAHLQKLTPHTGGVRLADDFLPQLKASVARFNEQAQTGKDLDFKRGQTPIEPFFHQFGPQPVLNNPHPNPTMHPLADHGPYYAVILVAGTLDTKGGPRIDEHARILDVRNRPIPGLYGAGNCVASPTGPAYWAGGATLGPAITFGALAAEHSMRNTDSNAAETT